MKRKQNINFLVESAGPPIKQQQQHRRHEEETEHQFPGRAVQADGLLKVDIALCHKFTCFYCLHNNQESDKRLGSKHVIILVNFHHNFQVAPPTSLPNTPPGAPAPPRGGGGGGGGSQDPPYSRCRQGWE
jgi:hypothetical protein